MKIALLGKIRSGKNTVGTYFNERYGCIELAFGDGIKRVLKQYFPHLYLEGKPRKALQLIGQTFRQIDPDIWVKDLHTTLGNYRICGNEDFVVTDVRQQNEYDYLKKQGFTVIKVETAPEIRLERIKEAGDNYSLEDLQHETETAVDHIPYDYLINNNTTIDDLYDQLKYITNDMEESR